jgi:sugar/nucleoside kinase (ribokinase family)
VPRVAVVGNLSKDRVDGGPLQPGGCPFFAVEALRRLGRKGQVATRYAAADEAIFESALAAVDQAVTLLPARTTSGFALDYHGEERAMAVTEIGSSWQAGDAAVLESTVEWVHVAPVLRSDFPAETLAALADGRKLSFDGQGLVRVPEPGPLTVDAEYDPALLASITVLKLAEDEAQIIAAPSAFDRAIAFGLGVPEVLLTLGSRGSIVYADGIETAVPAARPVLGVQTTGAGDVFMVAYIVARSDGADPVTAATGASRLVAEMLENRLRGQP